MKYINTKTGAIIDSPCLISGGDWVEYGKQKPKKEVIEEVKKTVEEPSTDLTKEEVINELDALGIEYSKKAKKEDLIKLMMGE
ncbi:hypothetical protein WKS98_03375 [Lagierella sp. ICN-221743]